MKAINKVNIIGMGALGMLYGSMIQKNLGAEHVAYVLDDARFERYKNDEYKINGQPIEFRKVRVSEAEKCDLLIVAVKYPGLQSALEIMESSVGEDTIIISVMNGISSEEIIGTRFGQEKVIHAIAQEMDAMHFGKELQYVNPGRLCVGIIDPAMQTKLDCLAEFLNRAGIAFKIEEDILHRMWSKFMVNVGINQTCMVYGTGYGGTFVPGSEANMVLISAMREVILLANAEGIHLTEDDLQQYLNVLRALDQNSTPSMGQDRINKKKSEVEMFAGTMLELGRKHGIPVPANAFLYRRVHEIEAEY